MPLPPEYVELLAAVVECLAGDARSSLRTDQEITNWLHHVAGEDVRRAVAGNEDTLMRRMARCVIENTHDPRLADWTPEQVAKWCNRARLWDVHAVLVAGRGGLQSLATG